VFDFSSRLLGYRNAHDYQNPLVANSNKTYVPPRSLLVTNVTRSYPFMSVNLPEIEVKYYEKKVYISK